MARASLSSLPPLRLFEIELAPCELILSAHQIGLAGQQRLPGAGQHLLAQADARRWRQAGGVALAVYGLIVLAGKAALPPPAGLVLTVIGLFRHAFMWRMVRGLEAMANGIGRFFAWFGLLMVLQQIVIIFLQRIQGRSRQCGLIQTEKHTLQR